MADNPIILFDGVCNFCNSSVNFIIKRDKKRQFRFAPLQSEAGQQLLNEHGLSAKDMDSFILVHQGRAYKKTTAALRVAFMLGGVWKLTAIFQFLPAPLRDIAYNIIANNRYRWFGKKEACMIPSPEVRRLFLS